MGSPFASLSDQTTLAISVVIALMVAALYAFVGRRVAQREVSPESVLAARMFAVWWYGLAAVTLVGALTTALAVAGVDDLPAFVTLTHVALNILCVALAGLLYYLAFLFTGKRAWFTPIVVFYGLFYIFLVAFITYQEPSGIEIGRWATQITYNYTFSGPVVVALILLLLVPIIAGAFAYFSLFFRVHDRSQRYRIALVAGTIAVWFTTSLVASFTKVTTSDSWQLVSRLIGVAAALAILWAYDPPSWIRRRLGVRSVVNQTGS